MIKANTPEYFRSFVRRWCAGADDARIDVTGGKGSPRFDRAPNAVTVGSDWLRSQAIPVEMLIDEQHVTPSNHPWRERDRAALAEGSAKRKGKR